MSKTKEQHARLSNYLKVSRFALQDLLPLLTDPRLYKKYIIPIQHGSPLFFGVPSIKALIKEICKKLGYKVSFNPRGDGIPEGFVSWLFVSLRSNLLTIAYNPKIIKQSPNPEEKTVTAIYRRLSKVLLHECGHASCHVDDLREKMVADQDYRPWSEPCHEQEAWFYVYVVLGILTGDFSWHNRVKNKNDEAWMLNL